jgi:hypothetical protein
MPIFTGTERFLTVPPPPPTSKPRDVSNSPFATIRGGCQPWFKKRGKVLSRPINRIVIAEIYDVDLQNLSHIIKLNV